MVLGKLLKALFDAGGEPPTQTVTLSIRECGNGNFNHDVTGESHRQPQIRAAARKAGHTLKPDEGGSVRFEVFLFREPGNRYDRNAIQVCDEDQLPLGYIPREKASELAAQLDNLQRRGILVSCSAKIVGQKKNYGVWLDYDTDEILRP